ncbi:uncharacterized protein TNCV_2641081 [Trichonephila clavipes]|nr:uncharacterized protein TNCV_2641081 [Trichonephila clavipes]
MADASDQDINSIVYSYLLNHCPKGAKEFAKTTKVKSVKPGTPSLEDIIKRGLAKASSSAGSQKGGQTAVEIEPLIERLNSTNYNTWKESVRVLLMDRNSRRIITDQEVTPDENASAKENWNFKSRWDRAYSTIYLSVEKEYRNLISDTCDPIVAWKTSGPFSATYCTHTRY